MLLESEYISINVRWWLTTSRIKNPLVGIPKDQLLQDVKEFAAEYNVTELEPYLIKGALVAQSPHHIDQIHELDEEDRRVLREETSHRWRHPKILYFTIILNSIAAAIQGWDQTGMLCHRITIVAFLTSSGSNGANLTFAIALGISNDTPYCPNEAICNRNSWLIGFVNSAPYICICLL
jgi:hypothetical protein